MKIQPVSIWYDGKQENATILVVDVTNLNLGKSAQINFRLFSSLEGEENYANLLLSNGIIPLKGQDYLDWGSDDSYIWNYVATKLNLVLIPD
jgi:hypothetical protein